MNRLLMSLGILGVILSASADTKIWLDELDISEMTSGWTNPKVNRSVDGHPMIVGGQKFKRGVGTHASSRYMVWVDGNALSFEADVGVDEEELHHGIGTVQFIVLADGKEVANSGIVRGKQPAKKIKANLTGAKKVELCVMDGNDGITCDHADWGNAFFTVKEGKKIGSGLYPPPEQLGILTPPTSPKPRINGAKIFGVRPGSPILFTLPVTGKAPITLHASNLPEGACFDTKTGRLSGKVLKKGTYKITFTAQNELGKATEDFRLVVGDTLALTPPMGWNSWNCFAAAVSDKRIRLAADAMVKSGLINHGWSYINIDDFWQNLPSERNDKTLIGPGRDVNGKIVPNKRFPDMKALTEYVHGLGLKIGIYSSPGPLTCGGCVGSWKHELQDAQTYAEWGFDYLKYDWCSYSTQGRNLLKDYMRPYLIMSEAFRAQKRDMILSLCQYGMRDVSAWGKKSGGQCWRTTGDITDTWKSMVSILDKQNGLELFAGPGAWNDPDMLIVGQVGWGNLHPTRLKPNEQYSHVSLWCMVCSPLLIGCDMTQLDAFTLNLLTNDEVLEVNQDPAGHAAGIIAELPSGELWAKTMSDDSIVVAFFNKSFQPEQMTFSFKDMNMSGTYRARDLWRQQDLGEASNEFSTKVLSHATQLIRFFPTK